MLIASIAAILGLVLGVGSLFVSAIYGPQLTSLGILLILLAIFLVLASIEKKTVI